MRVELRRLSPDDGRDVYGTLQKIPRDENGFVNPVNGMSFEQFREWLIKSDESSRHEGLEDGWKVP